MQLSLLSLDAKQSLRFYLFQCKKEMTKPVRSCAREITLLFLSIILLF